MVATLQRGSGLVQSLSSVQPLDVPQVPVPFTMLAHVIPVGQSLRGAVPQPGVQTPFGPLQIIPDIGPPQAGSASQPQSPVGRHSGFSPAHLPALLGEHSVQAPARDPEAWQAGRDGSGQLGAPSLVQGPQVCVVGEQTGVTPPQSAAVRHPTHTPVPLEVSQSGRAAGQLAVLAGVQAPQAPLGWHTGVAPPHWASAVQPPQVPVPALQTGVVPLHALVFFAEQTPHAPLGWHAGVVPPQSASAVQPRQLPVAVAQTGVAPVHIEVLAVEQTPHAPFGWQAGVAPLQSPSAEQPWQVPPAGLHTGVVPLHCAPVTHVTQVPLVALHTGVEPLHIAV